VAIHDGSPASSSTAPLTAIPISTDQHERAWTVHLFFSYVGNQTGSRNAQYKIRPHLPLERAKEFKHEPKRLEFAQDKYLAASTKYTPKYESPASLRLATRVSRAHHAADSSQTSLSTKRHCTLASSCARIRARARSSRPRTPLASI
jgi:hypothetical protein